MFRCLSNLFTRCLFKIFVITSFIFSLYSFSLSISLSQFSFSPFILFLFFLLLFFLFFWRKKNYLDYGSQDSWKCVRWLHLSLLTMWVNINFGTRDLTSPQKNHPSPDEIGKTFAFNLIKPNCNTFLFHLF